MSRSLRYLCSICISITTLFSACKKDSTYVAPASNYSDTTFPEAGLKANFNFKPGTYWIYKDSLSGRTDSFFVINNTLQAWQSLVHTGIGSAHFEYLALYSINIVDRNIDSPNVAELSSLSILLLNNYCTLDYSIGGEITSYRPLFLYPISTAITSSDTAETNTIVTSYPSYTLAGNTYSNVTEIAHDSTGTHDRFFICNGTGIVKMRIDHPAHSTHHVWELLHYRIVM